MLQSILIGAGIIAAALLFFFAYPLGNRNTDTRRSAPAPSETPERPDTRPDRPEGDIEV